jgi:hypothetical protein
MRAKVAHYDDPSQPWTPEKNAEFLQSLLDAGDGEVKFASVDGSNYTRRILRESQFTSHLLPERKITIQELMPVIPGYGSGLDVPEIGVLLCNIEPGNPGARTVSLETAAEQDTFRGAWYTVSVSKDEIPEMYKNIDKLALYKNVDVRQVVTDNALRELDNLPDYRLVGTLREITGSNPNAAGAGGFIQYQEITGGMDTRSAYKHVFRPLLNARLTNHVALMSRVTVNEFLGWDRTQIGGDKAEQILIDGPQALSPFQFNNTAHIASLKSNLLALGEIFCLAPPNFIGQNIILQEPTLWVKRVKDTITVSASCKRGGHIANQATVSRTVFTNL